MPTDASMNPRNLPMAALVNLKREGVCEFWGCYHLSSVKAYSGKADIARR